MEKMLFSFVKKTCLVIILLSLCSCDRIFPSFYVLLGNYRYEQGHYQEAVLYYFKALENAKNSKPIYYNLGTAYYALGESESALRMWSNLDSDTSNELKGLAAFNEGVVYYQLGRYNEAIKNFHRATKYLPENFEVKVNLELAINKRKETYENKDYTEQPENTISQEAQQTSARTLDYLRRRNLYFRGSPKGEEDTWQQEDNDW